MPGGNSMFLLMIVDDELKTREGIASLVNESDLPVKIVGKASNGIEGLAMARTFYPDIILTDVRMPQMNGITLSTEFKKINPACQIIFISGYSDKEYLKSAISLKAVSYVEKPLNNSELLNAVRTAIQNIKENRHNRFLHKQHWDMLSEKIAQKLLSPNISSMYLEKLQIYYSDFSRCSSYYALICQIDINSISLISNLTVIHDQIKSTLHSHGIPFLLSEKKSNILIIQLGVPDQNLLNLAVIALHTAISHLANAFWAVGSPVFLLDQLYLSYLNAVICLKKLFFLGYNNICYFTDQDTVMRKSFELNTRLLQEFNLALKDGDASRIATITTTLFISMRKTEYRFDINSIRDVYYRLLINLSSICTERNLLTVFSCDTSYIWEIITQKDTIFALQEYLNEKLTLYTNALTAKKGSSQLVSRIYQYVEHYFNNTDLSINKIAESLHYTPAYLCQIFKAETGNTINSYIHTFRINKAKELLKNKEIKLYEISLDVGYKNPDYFTIQFKKHVGMTPSEFREKYLL